MMDTTFYMQLDALIGHHEYDKAEEFLLKAFQEASADERNHADRITVSNELMGFYRERNRLPECEHYMKVLLREIRHIRLKGGLEYATLMLNVSNANRVLGNLDEAERYFLIVKDIYEKELPANDYRLATLYNNLSLVYRERGENEKAMPLMKKALEIVRALPGAGRAAAVSCINIANLLVTMGNADEADEYAKSAMGLLESAGQSDGIDYAAALAAGAKAALLRSDYDTALRNYEDAGKLMKNDSGRTDAYRAIIGRQIEILEMSGRKEEAERLRKGIEQ